MKSAADFKKQTAKLIQKAERDHAIYQEQLNAALDLVKKRREQRLQAILKRDVYKELTNELTVQCTELKKLNVRYNEYCKPYVIKDFSGNFYVSEDSLDDPKIKWIIEEEKILHSNIAALSSRIKKREVTNSSSVKISVISPSSLSFLNSFSVTPTEKVKSPSPFSFLSTSPPLLSGTVSPDTAKKEEPPISYCP